LWLTRVVALTAGAVKTAKAEGFGVERAWRKIHVHIAYIDKRFSLLSHFISYNHFDLSFFKASAK
jgi:hypothetical protein